MLPDTLLDTSFGWSLSPQELRMCGRSPLVGPRMLLVFRKAWLIVLLWLLASGLRNYDKRSQIQYFLIYLTNWVLVLQVVHMALALAHTVLSMRGREKLPKLPGKRDMLRCVEAEGLVFAVWVLQDLTYAGAAVVTTVYWAMLHGRGTDGVTLDGAPIKYVVNVHTLNVVAAALDCFVSGGPPVRPGHVWAPMLLGSVYALWTYINFYFQIGDASGRRYIYPAVDWYDPKKTGILIVGLVFVAVPLAHGAAWLLRLAGKYTGRAVGCFGTKPEGDSGAQQLSHAESGMTVVTEPSRPESIILRPMSPARPRPPPFAPETGTAPAAAASGTGNASALPTTQGKGRWFHT